MTKFKQYDLVVVNHDSDVIYRVVEVKDNNMRVVDATIDKKQEGWWHSMSGWKAPNYRQCNLLRESGK